MSDAVSDGVLSWQQRLLTTLKVIDIISKGQRRSYTTVSGCWASHFTAHFESCWVQAQGIQYFHCNLFGLGHGSFAGIDTF